MYSAVVFGWPATTIRPSRCTSTPTETMLVARSTSRGRLERLTELLSHQWSGMAIAHYILGCVPRESTIMAKPLLPDDLWEIIEPLLPKWTPSPKGGQPPLPDRQALTGILFVLKTGLPWE